MVIVVFITVLCTMFKMFGLINILGVQVLVRRTQRAVALVNFVPRRLFGPSTREWNEMEKVQSTYDGFPSSSSEKRGRS